MHRRRAVGMLLLLVVCFLCVVLQVCIPRGVWICALGISPYLAHASQVPQAVRVGAAADYTVRLKYSTSSNATLQLLAAVTLQSRKVDQILQQVAKLNDSIQHVISSAQGRQERAPQQQDPSTRSRVRRQFDSTPRSV